MADERNQGQERTEEATPRRQRKALEEGQVAKSMELSSVVIISLGVSALYLLGPSLVGKTTDLMRHVFHEAPSMTMTPESVTMFFRDTLTSMLLIIGPFLLFLTVIGVIVNLAQVGAHVTTKPLQPDFSKINPIAGFRRIFSATGSFVAARDLVKIALVCIATYIILKSTITEIIPLMDADSGDISRRFGSLAFLMAVKIAAILFVLAVFDFGYQKYALKKRLRMSKQELKEESKDTEGSPLVKSRLRQAQREIARRRMMQAIPSADVIITNPTHIAVALKYDRTLGEAPIVVAKGERLIAQKIRELGHEHGIPVIENKPLARALFKMCDIGMAIPANLYRAVAEILAYVYQLKGKAV